MLAAILTQSISSALSLINLVTQTVYEVKMMTTMLEQVSKGSFPALVSFINTARFTFNSLTWGIQSMRLPSSRGSTPSTTPSFLRALRRAARPCRSTGRSTRPGTRRSWVRRRWRRASKRRSRRSTRTPPRRRRYSANRKPPCGEVEQLQLVAQMIGITNSELLVLNQTLATTGRALTDLAAQSASEALSLGKGDDARAGYTDTNVVLSTMPCGSHAVQHPDAHSSELHRRPFGLVLQHS